MVTRKYDCLILGDIALDVFIGDKGKRSVSFVQGGTSYCNVGKIDFGGAGNVASGLSLLGSRICFVGKAGDDLWGKLYMEDLRARRIKTQIFFEKKSSTGIALIRLGKTGERSFCVYRGANDTLSPEEIDKSASLFRNSNYLYFSGYSLYHSPQKEAVIHAVNIAKENNLNVIFDPGSHNLIRHNRRLFNQLLDSCDVFSPNFEEAKAITESNTLKETIRRFQDRKILTALKCGKSGCFLISQEYNLKIPAFKTRCIDTTGAGDAFTAGLIFGLANQYTPASIGRLANWFAAQLIKKKGARSFPPKLGIDSFIRKLGTGRESQEL